MSRIRSDKIVNLSAEGAPQLSFGAEVPVGYGITGGGGLNLTGISTLGQCDFISGTKIESSGSFKVEDNSLLKVGTDNDLQIYHASGKSYITNTTGILEIKSPSNVELWQGSNKRIETTDTGAVVSGILSATNLNISGIATVGILTATNFNVSGIATVGGLDGIAYTAVETTASNKTLINREYCTVTGAGSSITLPASPSPGWEVGVQVGNFTDVHLLRNGSNIMGLGEDFNMDIAYLAVQLVYIDATQGWRFV